MERVESVRESDAEGVIVQCIKEKGKLRIRPVSQGYYGKGCYVFYCLDSMDRF